jgi:hypothetical protein
MGAGHGASQYATQFTQLNRSLIQETFPTLNRVKTVLSKDVKDFLPGKGKSPVVEIPGVKPPLVAEDVATAGDVALREEAKGLIKETEQILAKGGADDANVLDLAKRIRNNDLAVTDLNNDAALRKIITDTTNKTESTAMKQFCNEMAEKVGTSPENMVMKKWTGRAADEWGRDLDATAYQYVPKAGEPPPHISNPGVIKDLKPAGELLGKGKYYKDFATGQVKQTVPGQYYEPAVPLREQERIFNSAWHDSCGRPPNTSPDALAKDFNIKITTRLSNDSYGYTAEQTGHAITFKPQEPVSGEMATNLDMSRAYSNSQHEATKLVTKLDKTIKNQGISSNEIPGYERIQKGYSILKANEGFPLEAENALRESGTTTRELAERIGNAYYWVTK